MSDPQRETAPLVGIVVVTFNTRRFLARQRAALEAQTEQRWSLVVIDNASAPDERPMPADLPAGARLIQSETNLGFAAGNNLAVRALTTPFIALLNPDAFPEPTWLAELLAAAARHPHADAFGSTQRDDADPDRLDGAGDELTCFGFPYRALHRQPVARNRGEGESFSACAAAALYRTEAFRRLGGFDESLFCYCEDVDLGYRLRLGGGVSVQAVDAAVRHVGGGAASSDFADYHGVRNRLWVFAKNTPLALLWWLLPLHVAMSALSAAAPSRAARRRGLADGLSGLGAVLRKRKPIQGRAAAIARAMIWSPWAMARRAPKRSC